MVLQAALDRTKRELATQRESYDKAAVDLKAAEAAQQRAEDDLRTTRRKLDDALNKSNKSGAIWETMMKGKQEREVEVNKLQEQIAAAQVARDIAEQRVRSLEGEKDDLEVEKRRAQQRVRRSVQR
jgi:chromosome segregation ATPase